MILDSEEKVLAMMELLAPVGNDPYWVLLTWKEYNECGRFFVHRDTKSLTEEFLEWWKVHNDCVKQNSEVITHPEVKVILFLDRSRVVPIVQEALEAYPIHEDTCSLEQEDKAVSLRLVRNE